jgi:hypothetical protein
VPNRHGLNKAFLLGNQGEISSSAGTAPTDRLRTKLWACIRKNGLQDGKKKMLINADKNLRAVFNGKKQVSMFEMTKLVSGHVKK